MRNSEIGKIVADEFQRMKENFVGLSQNKIQDTLNRKKSHYRRNARILNKTTLKQIRGQAVQVRHQIDLMDIGKKRNCGISHRYVLTVRMFLVDLCGSEL